MRPIARRAAPAVLAATLALASSGLGTAASGPAGHPRATLDSALKPVLQRAASGARVPAVQVIVTGWTRKSLDVLDRLGVRHRHLRALPMAFVKLTPPQIAKVLGTKDVRSVYGDRRFRLMMNESGPLIGARHVADALKVTGAGSTIAVIDTGIDATHADLDAGKVVANYEVVSPNINDPGAPLLVESPMTDDNEHGTHVAGTVAGTGELAASDPEYAGRDLRGVAPGATLIGYSANQGPTLLETHTTAAFDHIIATRAQTGVRAISNSWGGGDGADFSPNDPTSVAQEAAWRAGIVPVFAAGNSGNPGDTSESGLDTLSAQCVSPFVVCVAAMTKHKQVVTFSSKGRPDGNWDRTAAQRYRVGMYRPTITAPGVNITAPAAISTADGDKPHGYLTISGTSMSTPMVSGVIALVTAANPKLTPAQITRILESTADPMPGWAAHEDGAGAVNARRAVEAALAMKAGRNPRLAAPKLGYAPPAGSAKEIAKFEGVAYPASYVHHQGVTDHVFTVAPGTERFDLQLSWETQAQNMYAFLWQPGVTPADNPSSAPFASQESWGLLCDFNAPCMLTGRKASVRYPNPGDWTLRVFGRTAAVAYTAEILAKTFKLPTTTATLSGGILSGDATFPALDARSPATPALAGTEQFVENPTVHKTRVYFHDILPVGGMTVDGSTWDTNAPSSEVPTMWQGAQSPILYAEFQATTAKPLQGAMPVSFWAGSTQGGLEWDLGLFIGPTPAEGPDEPVATTTATSSGLSEQPAEVAGIFPYVEVPANKLVRIQMSPRFLNDAHWTVYYDSVDMPSGMTLPVVDRFISVGSLSVPDATLTEALGSRRATLSWNRVEGATGYRIYRGSDPQSLRPAMRVAQVPIPAGAKSAAKGPLTVEGELTVGNPSNDNVEGLTEASFVITCPDEPDLQGLDGYVFGVPPESRDGNQSISVRGVSDLPYDLDVYFYDESCSRIDVDLASPDPDESGKIPAGSAWAIVNEYLGGPMSFTATLTRGGAVAKAASIPRLKRSFAGLAADTPAYFRVAAIDAAGREGALSPLLVALPASPDRTIELSVDGKTWKTVAVPRSRWSVPVATALAGLPVGAGVTTLKVRARAAGAAGPVTTVKAAGMFRPVEDPLPSTGLGDAGLGLALLAAAGGLGLRFRRRRTA